MRLYTTTGATQVDDPEFGTFEADANGAFDGLPDAMYAKLHGRPGWENDPERELRITREELDRFRDPAELLKAVRELGTNQGVLAAAIADALGLTQQPAAAAPPATTSASDSEAPPVESETPTESDEPPAGASGPEAATETPALAKAASGRGRGARAAKAMAADTL